MWRFRGRFAWNILTQKKEWKKNGMVPKRGKGRAAANRIDNPFPVVEKWAEMRAGLRVPIDANIDLYACGETDREKRSKSLFRIARMNIYDRMSDWTRNERKRRCKKAADVFRNKGLDLGSRKWNMYYSNLHYIYTWK